jgi:predicted nucleic acid-binding protein
MLHRLTLSVLRRSRTLKQGEAVLSVIRFGELVYRAEKSVQRAAALELLRELAQVLPVMGLPETQRGPTERFERSWNGKDR